MKALSLIQPWATLVTIRAKRMETRSWSTSYRGRIAVHASKGFPIDCRELCGEWPFDEALTRAGINAWPRLPRGAIIATCELIACVPTRGIEQRRGELWTRYPFSDRERAFGDFTPGRWAWLLADVQALAEPIPCRGALGLWDVPVDIEACIAQQAQQGGQQA